MRHARSEVMRILDAVDLNLTFLYPLTIGSLESPPYRRISRFVSS